MRVAFLLLHANVHAGPSKDRVNYHPAMRTTLGAFKEWERTPHTQSTDVDVRGLWPGHCKKPRGTLWLLGNSVARIHYFAALSLLNGVAAKGIEEQIAMCGKGGEWRGRRPGQGQSCLGPCSCSESVAGGGRLVFMWQQRLYHHSDELMIALNSTAGTSKSTSKLRSALQIADGDAVLFNTGLDDVQSLAKRATGKRRAAALLNRSFADWKSGWRRSLEDSAPQVAAKMQAAWQRGRPTFWRTSTPVRRVCAY